MANYYLNGKGVLVHSSSKNKKKKTTDNKVNLAPTTEEKDTNTIFKSGAFDDGYQFGDITKTILGTAGDVGVNVLKGATGIVEGVTDLASYGVAGLTDLVGLDDLADDIRKNTKESYTDKIYDDMEGFVDQYSVLGDKADAVSQGLGQVGLMILTGGIGAGAGLGTAGATALTTGLTFTSSMGSGMSEAYQSGATDEEAALYGTISGFSDAITEMLFAGLGKSVKAVGISTGLSSADDILAKKLSGKFTNQIAKNITEFGVKASAEGVEEVLAGIGSAIGKKVSYMSDKDFWDILEDEDLLEQFVVGTVTSGFAQSGLVPGMRKGSLIETTKQGRDFVTGYTQNEQKVIDSVVESRVKEAEADGKKLTKKEKNEIIDNVQKSLENGEISIDSIEKALGGETYTKYQSIVDKENEIKKKISETKNNENLSDEQKKILTDAYDKEITELGEASNKEQLKSQLSEEVQNLLVRENGKNVTSDDYLIESYNEKARRSQKFEIDYSKYDENQQKAIKTLIEGVEINNTKRVHKVVDYISKIASDKNITIRLSDTNKLKEMGFSIEGKTVNGLVDKNGDLFLNIESKKSLNAITGHEITHLFEGTDYYKDLKDAAIKYAEAKGEYDSRFATLKEVYKKAYAQDSEYNSKVEKELVADIIGDYLFTDEKFIQNLSIEQPNIFKKIYEEIKYMLKVVTAGSEEARELEKVKRAFEKAYQTADISNVTEDVKYSITESFVDENGNKYESAVLLDTDIFDGISPRNWGAKLKEYVEKRSSENPLIFPIKDENGDDVILQFAKPNERVTKDGKSNHRVIDKLINTSDNLSKLAVVHIDEIVPVSKEKVPYYTSENNHQWLDEKGWLHRNVNVINTRNGNIYNLTFDIAKTSDGRNILYATNGNIKKVGNVNVNSLKIKGSWQNSNFDDSVPQNFNLSSTEDIKAKQLDIILNTNPANDSYHTWIRNKDDILTFEEALNSPDYVDYKGEDFDDSYPYSIAEEALRTGKITVYSSYPIKQGVFVSPSKMEAQSYKGSGKVYSKEVNLTDVAWIDPTQGQYAQITDMDDIAPTSSGDIDPKRISSNEWDVQYSLTYNSEIAKGQSDYLLKQTDKHITNEELASAQEVTNAMVGVMIQYSSILPEDKIGKVLTNNGSYDKSVENTTICVRTLAYNEFVDKVQEELGRPLTQMESFLVSQKLYDIAVDPQCLYCYVSLDRKAFNDMLLRYMNDRDTVIAKYNNSDKTSDTINKLYEEFLRGRKDTPQMKARFNKWISYVDNGTQLLSLADIATESRQSKIQLDGGTLAEQLKDARQYAQSASWSKIQKDYVAYKDEILKMSDKAVKDLNKHYGLRWYSFSDYSPAFIVENMQQITDASIRGLKGLAYTKDTDFAEIFAKTGMNINVSVFVNTDENGDFYIDEKQSANFQKALELREKFPNIGIVATVTNDEALRWAASQEWSDVIIPFHIVRTGTDVAEYYKWLNYTAESGDTIGNKDLWNSYLDSLNIKSENARKKVSKNIYPSEHKNNKETYLNLCESRGLTPRFVRFAGEDWYMKLVNETRLSADESAPLKPIYDEDVAKASFSKFVEKGGYKGGWYNENVDVDAEVKQVAEDVLAGKQANEVDYGRQDKFNPTDLIKNRKTNRTHSSLSLSEEGQDIAPIGNYNVYGSDLAIEEIAPPMEADIPIREDIQQKIDGDWRAEIKALKEPVLKDGSWTVDYIKYHNSVKDKVTKIILNEIVNDVEGGMSKEDLKQKSEEALREYDSIHHSGEGYTEAEQLMLSTLFNRYDWYRDLGDGIGRFDELKSFLDNYDAKVEQENNVNIPSVLYSKNQYGENGWGDMYDGSGAALYDALKFYDRDLWSKQRAEIENASIKHIAHTPITNAMSDVMDYVRQETISPMQGARLISEEYRANGNDPEKLTIFRSYIEKAKQFEFDIAPIREDIAENTKAISEEHAPIVEDNEVENVVEESKPVVRKELHANIINNIKQTFAKKGLNFDDVLQKAKNKSAFASVDNTPQRFIEKSLGYEEGQILNDLTVNKVAQNESKGVKWVNSFTDKKNGLLAQISKQYGIKPRSKESALAQMYAEGFYVNEENELVKYGDEELAKDVPGVKMRENIKKLAKDERIRKIYDETLKAINDSRTRNAYPEIPKRDNYFLHFRAMDDTFSRLGLPFNPNDIRAKDLPTDLNGVTADLKPGQPYFGSAMRRTGYKTTYDLLGGVERYLNSAKNQIYHIDDIQTLRALRNYIADTYGQAKGLESLDVLTEEEAEQRIKDVYNSHLSNFAKFLNEEANIIAGKTSLVDRGLEGIVGRRGLTFMNEVNQLVGKNYIAFNVASPFTNLLSTVQSIAKSSKSASIKAFSQMVSNKLNSINGKSDGFAEKNPLIIRRKGIEKLSKTPVERISDKGYWLMSAIDNFSTEFIVRTKFNEFTQNGMSEEQAHIEADKWASRLLGDRSLGQMPQIFNSKALGLFTKFQLEVRNQLDSQFYDTIQEAKMSNKEIEDGLVKNSKTAAKVTSTLVQLAVFQHIFGQAFESVVGYNPAFDIIEVLMTALGFDDEEESEDTALDNIEQGFLELVEDMPYLSTFTGGRIPIESALPIKELVTGKDSYGNEKSRWETVAEALPYYNPIGGYNQLKKTVQGLAMFDDDLPIKGSYTDNGNLRFSVEDTPLNRLQAGLFGQWANEDARDYLDNNRQPLKSNQIEELKELDIPIRDYWEYREGLTKQDTLDEKFDYIASLDLPVAKKNIMINNIVNREEDVNLEGYEDFSSYAEFDFATKYPDKYAVAQVVGGYETFVNYMNEINNITADTDKNGKTINGSRKAKVIKHIESLKLSAGEKQILYKMQYPSDNSVNYSIVMYLDGLDISYKEKVEIAQALGMIVDDNGNVRWN